jgi:hypothetical protein
MTDKSLSKDLISGMLFGFVIETFSSIGSPYLATIFYRFGGVVINVDPFLILYPLVCISAIAAYLCIRKKRLYFRWAWLSGSCWQQYSYF